MTLTDKQKLTLKYQSRMTGCYDIEKLMMYRTTNDSIYYYDIETYEIIIYHIKKYLWVITNEFYENKGTFYKKRWVQKMIQKWYRLYDIPFDGIIQIDKPLSWLETIFDYLDKDTSQSKYYFQDTRTNKIYCYDTITFQWINHYNI